MLGRLTVGFFMDDRLAAQFKGVTGAEIAFAAGGRVLASSLPAARARRWRGHRGAGETATVNLGDEEFLALARPMQTGRPPMAPVTARSCDRAPSGCAS